MNLVEVDYPSASFGTAVIAPGGDFRYRFKILGSGATSIVWTDGKGREHKNAGPALHEGEEGQLRIEVAGEAARWSAALH